MVLTLKNYLIAKGFTTAQFAKKINGSRQNVDNWLAKEDVEGYETVVHYDVRTSIIHKVTTMKMKVVYERAES